jgi:GWxTD domain-containing protein
VRYFFRCCLATLLVPAILPETAIAQNLPERVQIRGSSLTAPDEIARVLDPFRANPDSNSVANVLTKEAEANGFPAIGVDHVLVARMWRRAGEHELALAALASAPLQATSPILLLERARVLMESDVDRVGGAAAFWAACESLDAMTRSEIDWDLLVVSTPAEWAAWGTTAPRDDCTWLRDFWNERAQGMALTADERVALHYRRLARARDLYWIPRPRISQGWADRLGRPDALPLDDRGLIYVRMGEPAADEGFMEDVGQTRCWPYWRRDGYRIFCFAQIAAGRVPEAPDVLGADADYKIQQAVMGSRGTGFYQRYFANAHLPRAARLHRTRFGSQRLGRVSFDDRFWQADLDIVEYGAYEHQIRVATRENIKEVLQTVPDAPEIVPSIRFRFETLRFLNPSESRWQIWLLAGVRAGDLTVGPDSTRPMLEVGGRYASLSDREFTAGRLTGRSLPAGAVDEDAAITLRGSLSAQPGPLPLTVAIEDGNDPTNGSWLKDTLSVPAVRGLPQLSDIAVAQSEGGTWTRDGETFLQVSPSHITNTDGTVHTYFEVYGIRSGNEYDVEVRLAGEDKADRIFRLDPDDLAFRLEFGAEANGDVGRHHLRLELGDTDAGEYVLAVRVRDTSLNAYSLPAITNMFVAE